MTARRGDGSTRDNGAATFFEVDTELLNFLIGTRGVVALMNAGDLRVSSDGVEIIRREAFSSGGWVRLVNHDVIGESVTP